MRDKPLIVHLLVMLILLVVAWRPQSSTNWFIYFVIGLVTGVLSITALFFFGRMTSKKTIRLIFKFSVIVVVFFFILSTFVHDLFGLNVGFIITLLFATFLYYLMTGRNLKLSDVDKQ